MLIQLLPEDPLSQWGQEFQGWQPVPPLWAWTCSSGLTRFGPRRPESLFLSRGAQRLEGKLQAECVSWGLLCIRISFSFHLSFEHMEPGPF